MLKSAAGVAYRAGPRRLPLRSASVRTLAQQSASRNEAQATNEGFFKSISNHSAFVEFQQRGSIQTFRTALTPAPEDEPLHLIHTTLSGPGLIDPRPHVFADDKAGSVLAFYRLGQRLAGHGGLVHGGLAASLLDECMCRACFPRLPNKIAVTANLNIDYKSPIAADSNVVICADTISVEGRKAKVRAKIKDMVTDKVLVVAEGLFIEPRWASKMAKLT